MNKLPPNEVIRVLRAQLEHFDRSPDFGDGEAVQVIRQHLLTRIREVEGAMRCRAWLEPQQILRAEAA
jgi:hypothetical protein